MLPVSGEHIATPPARVRIVHWQPKRDSHTGLFLPPRLIAPEVVDLSSVDVLDDQTVTNLITNAGRDFLISQAYGLSPAGNGLNFLAVSNDAVSEDATSTTLSNEITTNGFARAQGGISHTTGTNLVLVSKMFTCTTSTTSIQKLALFTASSSGTMSHVVGFAQRAVLVGAAISVTASITLG